MKKEKILTFDEESSPMLGWFWGRMWETDIIKKVLDETIMMIGYKEYGKKGVHVIAQCDFPNYKPGVLDDRELCIAFSKIVNKYDRVSGHNSDNFDLRLLNARLAYHKLPPIAVEKTLDTIKLARRLKLPSYKLDEIASFFKIPGKYNHAGQKMWFECMNGNMKYWRMMKKYCKQDVVITDQILERLLPYAKQKNDTLRLDEVNINCSNPICGSKDLVLNKKRRIVGGYKNQWQCRECGRYTTDPKKILTK